MFGRLLCRIGWHDWKNASVVDEFDDGAGGKTLRVVDYAWCKRDDCPKAYKPRVINQDVKRIPSNW